VRAELPYADLLGLQFGNQAGGLLRDLQFLKTFENFEIAGRTLQHEQIAGLHLFIRRRHAQQFLATHKAYHGQTECIPQAAFDQIMLGQHRSRWNAHRQQLGTVTGKCLHSIRRHEAQFRDKAQAGQFFQRLPFSLQQQSLPPQVDAAADP
jgi:hypothetical protein